MLILLVYALLTSALFYLGSRAIITRWLWSKYPPSIAQWADCAACSGAWYGVAVGALGRVAATQASIPWLPPYLMAWWAPIVVGLCSVVWTPIVAGLMQRGFEQLGSVIPPE